MCGMCVRTRIRKRSNLHDHKQKQECYFNLKKIYIKNNNLIIIRNCVMLAVCVFFLFIYIISFEKGKKMFFFCYFCCQIYDLVIL